MPADDLVLNIRQIANYTQSFPLPTDLVLVQRGGLGGPYFQVPAQDLVAESLIGGDIALTTGALGITWFGGPSVTASVAGLNFAWGAAAPTLTISPAGHLTTADQVTLGRNPAASMEAATASWVAANTAASFNGRTGPVCLWVQDIINAGGAPLFSPVFGGQPRAPTPAPWSNSSRIATTGFVQRNSVEYIDRLLKCHPFVFSFNGRTGDIVLTEDDVINAGGGQIFNNPTFTGIPVAPTAPLETNTTQIATTEFVQSAIASSTLFAPLASPAFTGYPSGPTAPAGSSTGQFATTAFVMNAVTAATAGVSSFNTRTGAVVLTGADLSAAGGALLVSPIFTGSPQAPTAALGTSSAQLATTAFVMNALGAEGVESFNGRVGAVTLTTADLTGAGGAPLSSPGLTGIPTAPTAAASTNTTQIATTAFVMNAIVTGGVTSFNTRTGAITLLTSDISAAGGASLVSPVFTGVPVAPTAAPNTSTTQIATCAFVAAAIAGSVASFNGRTGAVTFTASDVSAVGGATLASPHFTGAPTAPTPTTGDNSTALATTAYVLAAIAATGGVLTFNGRTGAVTLSAADISAAGGAPLSSPNLIGVPTAPTAAASTNTTQLATTAFVMNALSATGGVASFNGRAGSVTLTMADVTTALPSSAANPPINGTAAPGSSAAWSRGDHVHPTDSSLMPLSGGIFSGPITVPQGGGLAVNGPVLSNRSIVGETNGAFRWLMALGDGAAESGANQGSNFVLTGYNDAGTAAVGNALTINRTNLAAIFPQGYIGVQSGLASTNPGVNLLNAGGAAQSQYFWDNANSCVITTYGSTWHRLNGDGSFQIFSTTATKPGGGAWTAPSDDRIKTVLGDYDKGLDDVLALRPVTFVYKGNDTRTGDLASRIGADPDEPAPTVTEAPFPSSDHYQEAIDGTEFVGFVAQELEAVFPSMVTSGPGFIDGHAVSDLRQVDVSNLVYILVNAVKALAAKVEALEAT